MRISTVLFIVGALALIFGLGVVGFGIPVQEFSFGNTLIMAGATVATGGLVVMALAAVVAQLQRLNEALGHIAVPVHDAEAFEAVTPPVEAAHETRPFEPRGPSAPPETPMPVSPAPLLRNPDEPVEVPEQVSLSPQPTLPEADEQEPEEPRRELPAWMRSRPAPSPEPEPAEARPTSSFFDSMWPPENKMLAEADKEGSSTAPAPETIEPEAAPQPEAREPEPEPAPAEPAPPPEKPRAVAILKSGVVDGMGYTLYVDGSIEAELPQGTLRFASIHELRAHLEQNG